jgi:hypothetical protein
MELLGELLLGLLQVIGELLLQLVFEGLAEFGVRGVKAWRRSDPLHPVVAGIGYAGLGAALGGVSLWIWPDSFAHAPWTRWLGLVVVPILAGLAMGALGDWRARRDQELIRLDRFSYAFIFAFAMALVRFLGTR